ncbi:putative non-LTR retroelement reverse transcriptase [Trifolium medium]|uniref:Putative non-LTR retroelement reverse transcriptase n=1 Tax=Trifolium medium TaxID=97028 RepID=A0A392NSN8_9FABA|nr:putative non-LTR retroelement reverse transcriptase [Trifolium medium]
MAGEFCMKWKLGTSNFHRFASIWWKDICDIENVVVSRYWFVEGFVRKTESGDMTRFWYDCWIGDVPLCVEFPRLFSISNQKDAVVRELCVTEDNHWVWNFEWRRRRFEWEEALITNLLEVSMESL